MRLLIVLFAISRLGEGSIPYHGVTVGITSWSAPVHTLHSQHHTQDKWGQYVYGYTTGLSAKEEIKTADGVTRGGYSYIDANGILQNVQYISDPVHGFRVAATNIVRDVPAVAYARAQHLAAFEHIKVEHALIAERNRQAAIAAISPVPVAGGIVVPVRAAHIIPTPVTVVHQAAAYAPVVVATGGQFHAQDNHGQYSYGYGGPLSAKTETKTADGVTRGGYSYIDANGILQTVQYTADPVHGFRVIGTNLPVAPAVEIIGPKVTTTVVGPKDNTGGVVLTPSVNTVPVSVAIDSVPGYSPDVIQNANIPVNPVQHEGPYLQPNPNHQAPINPAGPGLYSDVGTPVYNSPPVLTNPNQAGAYHPQANYQVDQVILSQPAQYSANSGPIDLIDRRPQVFFDPNAPSGGQVYRTELQVPINADVINSRPINQAPGRELIEGALYEQPQEFAVNNGGYVQPEGQQGLFAPDQQVQYETPVGGQQLQQQGVPLHSQQVLHPEQQLQLQQEQLQQAHLQQEHLRQQQLQQAHLQQGQQLHPQQLQQAHLQQEHLRQQQLQQAYLQQGQRLHPQQQLQLEQEQLQQAHLQQGQRLHPQQQLQLEQEQLQQAHLQQGQRLHPQQQLQLEQEQLQQAHLQQEHLRQQQLQQVPLQQEQQLHPQQLQQARLQQEHLRQQHLQQAAHLQQGQIQQGRLQQGQEAANQEGPDATGPSGYYTQNIQY